MKLLIVMITLAVILSWISGGLIGYGLQPKPEVVEVRVPYLVSLPVEVREVIVEVEVLKDREIREFGSKKELVEFVSKVPLVVGGNRDCDDFARAIYRAAVGEGYEMHCQYEWNERVAHMLCWTPIGNATYKIDWNRAISYWFPLD